MCMIVIPYNLDAKVKQMLLMQVDIYMKIES